MRKLVALFTILFFIASLVAQEKKVEIVKEPKVTTETPYYKIIIDPIEIERAGKSLRQFKNTTYLGYAGIYGGAIIAYFGVINRNEKTNEIEPNQTLLWTGGLTSLIGLVITITASHKVDEAGKHLQNAIVTEP